MTGNTLPQAQEGVNFQFEVNGLTRSDYDQHARVRVGAHFMSIGSRDNCVLPGTKVKIHNSLINIEDICVGDKVLTHKRDFKKVLNMFIRQYFGEIISFKFFGHFEEIKVTPEHPVYVIKREKLINKKVGRLEYDINKAEWILAKNIEKGDCVIEAIEDFYTQPVEFDLSKYYERIFIGNQFGKSKKKHHIDIGEKINKIQIDENWATLIGWYLAEGCLMYRYDKCGNRIDSTGIVLCIGKTDYERGYVEEIKNAIKNINKNIKIKEIVKPLNKPVKLPQGSYCENPQPAYYIKFFHRQIAKFIKEHFNEYSHDKRLPEWILDLDKTILKVLLESFCKGDGVFRDGKIMGMGCVNQELICSLHRICDKIGENYNFHKHGVGIEIVPAKNGGVDCKTLLKDGFRFRLIRFITKQQYKGNVYNLEIDGDNSYTLNNVTVHNCKLDADFLLYDDVMKRIENNPEYKKKVEEWIKLTKDIYEETINADGSSWQSGRCFLPQSINHSYVFGMNLLAMKGQMTRRLMACEQEGIVTLHWLMRKEIEKMFPFLASFLRPACDNAKKCIYMSGPEGLTKFFSNLFDGCGRWPVVKEEDKIYCEFNRSCTDYERLKEFGIPVIGKNEFINYTFDSYSDLNETDKVLFEEN